MEAGAPIDVSTNIPCTRKSLTTINEPMNSNQNKALPDMNNRTSLELEIFDEKETDQAEMSNHTVHYEDNDSANVISNVADDNGSNNNSDSALTKALCTFVIDHNITECATDGLLKILHNCGHSGIPKDYKTLLQISVPDPKTGTGIYQIVEFLHNGQFACVPSFWIKNNQVRWDVEQGEDFARNCFKPHDHWQVYYIRNVKDKPYHTYEDGEDDLYKLCVLPSLIPHHKPTNKTDRNSLNIKPTISVKSKDIILNQGIHRATSAAPSVTTLKGDTFISGTKPIAIKNKTGINVDDFENYVVELLDRKRSTAALLKDDTSDTEDQNNEMSMEN